MESKLNHRSIEAYSRDFADKVTEDFFRRQETISGQEILHVTPVRQVNLFVLRILFFEWQEEMKRIRSPYFDYNNAKVQEALENLMNILSRNILLQREAFGPLLMSAVHDALLLVFSPYDFYTRELRESPENKVTIEYLENSRKYIKVNSHLLDGLISALEKEGLTETTPENALLIFDQALEGSGETPEDLEEYFRQFSQVVPLEAAVIYSEENRKDLPSGEQKDTLSQLPLHEKFRIEKSTVHQQFGTGQPANINGPRIDSLRKNIGINQRVMFINGLFGGDTQAFENTLDHLDQCQSYEEAKQYLDREQAGPRQWDKEAEEVAELYEMISRRHA